MRTSPESSMSTPETSPWACRKALSICSAARETLAGDGEVRAGGAAVEQFGAERGLQRRDAAAHRRMVEPQPLGGGDELPGAGDGEEDPTLSQSMGKMF